MGIPMDSQLEQAVSKNSKKERGESTTKTKRERRKQQKFLIQVYVRVPVYIDDSVSRDCGKDQFIENKDKVKILDKV